VSIVPYPPDAELSVEARDVLGEAPFNIVRMWANAPAALRPMSALGHAIVHRAELTAPLREIAILAVAQTSRCEYERVHHENLSRAIGMAESTIRAAADGDVDALGGDERLVWQFAAQIAGDVRADPAITEQLLARLGRRQVTELVLVAGFYGMLARIIETCGVELEADIPTWTSAGDVEGG
jgi:4-carboxymuconolactone decarboxylase